MNRADKIDIIMDSRSDWTLEDYKEAYADVWNEMPTTVVACNIAMADYIYHTYDDSLIDEILEEV